MRAKAVEDAGIQRQLEYGLLFFAFACFAFLAAQPGRLGDGSVPSVALVLLAVALVKWIESALPNRPIHIGSLFILIASTQPVALLATQLFEGSALYSTALGVHSHDESAVRVAGASALFLSSYAAAFILWPVRRRGAAVTWEGLARRLDEWSLRALVAVAVVSAIVRVVLLFGESLPNELKYVLRLLYGYCFPFVFFVGVEMRLRPRRAAAAALLCGASYLVVFVSGSRGDAIVPLAYLGLGFAVAARMPRLARYWFLPSLGAILFLALGVGEVLRSDNRGRTASAAADRFEEYRAGQIELWESDTVIKGSVRRLLRNGSHAVLAGVPERLAFEEDGLVRLPLDFLGGFLPRFKFEGIDLDREPRNAVMNYFGFLVNWKTSVELAALPDAWLRGGWKGIILIGSILGAYSRLIEEWVYRRLERDTVFSAVLVVLTFYVGLLEGKDFCWGVRSTVIGMVAASLVCFCVRVIAGPELARSGRRSGVMRSENMGVDSPEAGKRDARGQPQSAEQGTRGY